MLCEFFDSEVNPEVYGELLCVFGSRSKLFRIFINNLTCENKTRLIALVKNKCFSETSINEDGGTTCTGLLDDYIKPWRKAFNKREAFLFWFKQQTKEVRLFVYFSVSHVRRIETLCAPLLL